MVNKSTLDSGLRVITEHIDSVRSLSVGIWVKTGSRHETDRQAGITHFLEHMLFKGTQKRSAYDIAFSMESVGGYLNAFTSSEYTCYYTRCLDTELERALDVLSDMVLSASLPEKEIEKEKKVVVEEMKMYRDSPDDYVFEEFTGMIFAKHPLGRPIIGYENTVNSFTQDDLRQFMNERYQPDNIIVAVAGNAGHEDVLKLAENYFNVGGEKTQELASLPLSSYTRQRKEIKKPIEQTHFVVGRRSLSADHEDRFKLLLANTVLGSGMSSRLHQNIREKYGYCYSIQSFNQSFYDTGMFGVYTGTDQNYVDHVKELIFNEFTRLKNERIPENDLDQARTQLKGKLLLAQENMSSRMTRLAKSELYYDRYITLDELVEQIDAVSPDEIRKFAAYFFDEEQFSETVLLPEK